LGLFCNKKVEVPPEYRSFKCECGGEWFVPTHTARQNTATEMLRHSEARMLCVNCGAIYTSFYGVRIEG